MQKVVHTQTSMPASGAKIRTRTKLVLGEHVNHTQNPAPPTKKKKLWGKKMNRKSKDDPHASPHLTPMFSSRIFFFIILFIYFWLC